MTWYADAWSFMAKTHTAASTEGKDGMAIAKAIDDGYPYGERSGWPYKAWRAARRDFFRKHNLPLRRARQPGADLLARNLEEAQ